MSWRLVIGVVGAVAWMAAGCSTGEPVTEEDDDREVVGRPPSQSDDPFEIMQTPAEARRAASSGYIGEGEAARASEAKPEEEKPDRRAGPSEVRCFSCVRICPVDDGGGTEGCGERDRDVICGWGVHGDRQRAGELARAECNGALEMAREMGQWRRIEGGCPPASCRSGESDD